MNPVTDDCSCNMALAARFARGLPGVGSATGAADISGLVLRGIPASPGRCSTRRLRPLGRVLFAQSEPPPPVVLAPLRKGPRPRGRARDAAAARTRLASKRVAGTATPPGSAAAGGASGWAGPGTAPGNSRACWAALRLPRWSGTWRCPWAGRRGGGEGWERLTGRRANAGTGRLGSPPGVSIPSPPGLFAGSAALR